MIKSLAEAKKLFPELKPSRIGSYSLVDDGKSVIITGYDEKVSFVLDNETDIGRLQTMCELALKTRKKGVGKNRRE